MFHDIVYIFLIQGIVFLSSQPANAATLQLIGASPDEFVSVSLNNAVTLLNSPLYNKDLNNVFYTHGVNGDEEGNATETMLKYLIALRTENVFFFNWSKESYIGNNNAQIVFLYGAVIANAKILSKEFGIALLNMSNCETTPLNLAKTHLIGFSLGAHLCGDTGRYVKAEGAGKTLGWISGLDPAGPIYSSSFGLLKALDSTCAVFVDIYHCDPGHLGYNASLGTCDIWPNFDRYISGSKDQQVQPGCPTGNFPLLSPEGRCSHDRCWMLYAESINNLLQASGPANYYAWAAGSSTTVIFLGYSVDKTAKGDYHLVTNSESPFGKGPDGIHP